MSNTIEDFPALPITENKFEITRNSKSRARSSVSTTSIGATEAELTYVLAQGKYLIMDAFQLRPYLNCSCKTCQGRYPTAADFGKCLDVINFNHSVFRCTVSHSRIVRHRTAENYSVSYITTDLDMIDSRTGQIMTNRNGYTMKVQGWVKSKFLRPEVFTSQSVESVRRNEREVDRSRSPSVFNETPFQFGDLVLVNPDGNKWVRGEVRRTSPLLILVEGDKIPLPFHISQLRNHQSRQFVAVKDLSVRRNKHRGDWSNQTIKAGTTLKVAYMDGYEGRIVAPFQGWITMRDSAHSSLNVVEADWRYTTTGKLQPTIFVTNLPNTLTELSLRNHLREKCYVTPRTIAFQRKGDKVRAVVTFGDRFGAISSLVQKGTSEVTCGWNVSFKWDMAYLKNQALYKVQHPTKKQTRV